MFDRFLAVAAVALTVLALTVHAALADAQPYGPAPQSMTWNAPPDGRIALGPRSIATLPKCATDVDVWIRRRASDNRPSYRLRQRVERHAGWNQYAFTLAHRRRAIVGYVPENRDVINMTTRRNLVVYYWCA